MFQRRSERQLVQHQKFFFFDLGAFRSLRPRGPLDTPQEIERLALETLVAQHLRAFVQLRRQGATLSFWCIRAGLEVKRSARIDKRALAALHAYGVD